MLVESTCQTVNSLESVKESEEKCVIYIYWENSKYLLCVLEKYQFSQLF